MIFDHGVDDAGWCARCGGRLLPDSYVAVPIRDAGGLRADGKDFDPDAPALLEIVCLLCGANDPDVCGKANPARKANTKSQRKPYPLEDA